MDKILLVDDVKLLLEIQKGLLSSSRVKIFTAADGHEALAVTRNELPNLIVMDNHMPKMDGVTCCREIKADPQLQHIPVIMLSNELKDDEVDGFRAAGFSECLAKPIKAKQFLTTLKKYLPAIECRSQRVPVSLDVILLDSDTAAVCKSKDISLNGINIVSEIHPSPGDEVRFTFVLPGSDAQTEVRGKVAWSRRSGDAGEVAPAYEFGIEFIEITGKGIPFIRKNELGSFVARHNLAESVDA
jgi:CheY-like chemotaxis protein